MTEEQPAPGNGSGRAPRRPGVVLPLASALAVVFVTAGSTVAYRSLAGDGGPQPEDVAPASTFAFLEVDLEPSAGERLDLYRFSRRFPGSPTERSGDADGVVDVLLNAVVEASGAPVDYRRDIRPWLGGAAAVAAYRNDKGAAAVVGILGYDDRAAAKRALDDVFADAETGGYAFTADFVLIAADRPAAEQAARLAQSAALADTRTFAEDVGALGERLLTVWADQRSAVQAVGDQVGGLLGGIAGQPQPLTPRPAPTLDPEDVPEGRFVLGLAVDSDVAEIEARTIGGKQASGDPGARQLATDLPAGTTGVLAVGDVRPAVRGAVDALRKGPLAGLVNEAFTSAERESGLKLPDDLLTLLGHAAALSGTTKDGEDGDVVLRSRPDDMAAARAVAAKLQRLGATDGEQVVVRVEGQELVIATSAAAASAVLGGGDLADTDLFRKAVGDIAAEPVVVGYLDLRPFVAADDEDVAGHLRAVGVSAGTEEGAGVFRIRVVVE